MHAAAIQKVFTLIFNHILNKFFYTILLIILVPKLVFGITSHSSISNLSESYRVGDTIDVQTSVLNQDMQVIQIRDLIRSSTDLVVLIVFGGAVKQPSRDNLRSNLWCLDSFDDLGVQRALVSSFQNRAVQFVPVAVPPVYSPKSYGYAQNVFLGKSESSPQFRAATRAFINATEKEIQKGILPFKKIYYDPKFYLGNQSEHGPKNYPWQGKLRWPLDRRQYGTPILWLLDSQGKILQEPFFGNDYDSTPPQIHYGYHKVKEAIEIKLKELHADHE